MIFLAIYTIRADKFKLNDFTLSRPPVSLSCSWGCPLVLRPSIQPHTLLWTNPSPERVIISIEVGEQIQLQMLGQRQQQVQAGGQAKFAIRIKCSDGNKWGYGNLTIKDNISSQFSWFALVLDCQQTQIERVQPSVLLLFLSVIPLGLVMGYWQRMGRSGEFGFLWILAVTCTYLYSLVGMQFNYYEEVQSGLISLMLGLNCISVYRISQQNNPGRCTFADLFFYFSAVLALIYSWGGLLFQELNLWVVDDFMGLFLVSQLLKSFKLREFRKGALLLLLFSSINLGVLIWELQQQSEKSRLLQLINRYSNCWLLQLPTWMFAANRRCNWISIFDLILPALVISFTYRLDFSRNARPVYTMLVIASLAIPCLIAYLVQIVFGYILSLTLIVGPVIVLVLSLFAFKRGELQEVWRGEFEDGLGSCGRIEIRENWRQECEQLLKSNLTQ